MKCSDRLQECNLKLLTEIFPSVPENLFYPLLELNFDTLNNVISDLTSQDDSYGVMSYLMRLANNEDIKFNNKDIKNKIQKQTFLDSLSPMDDQSSETLVIGKKFLEGAHKKFSSKYGLEHINISDIPTEITEMKWKVPENLMMNIYRLFLEELGLVGNKEVNINSVENIENEENLSMREIIDLEQAFHNSVQIQNDQIQSNDLLMFQVNSLQLKFPDISLNELKRIFILCNMDSQKTMSTLLKNGHTPQSFPKKFHLNKDEIRQKGLFINSAQVDQIYQQINKEENRIDHISDKLSLVNKRDLHNGVENYWREELHSCKKRLTWFQNQLAIAKVDYQSVSDSQQLDLHGYKITEAIAVIDNTIAEIKNLKSRGLTQMKYLTIICGRGLHSYNGLPRLKPVVKNHLTQSKIKFTHYSDGAFRVCLNQFKH